jgi:hypothetical protein
LNDEIGGQYPTDTCGERQRALLAYRAGEVDLMFVGGKWYLAVVCDMPDPEKIGIEDVLGVDFARSKGGRALGGRSCNLGSFKLSAWYNRERCSHLEARVKAPASALCARRERDYCCLTASRPS